MSGILAVVMLVAALLYAVVELLSLRSAINLLRSEVELWRMRVVACGVVACADTTESAAWVRDMHQDFRSASCDDVARRVDECIALRATVQQLLEAVKFWLACLDNPPELRPGPQVKATAMLRYAAAKAEGK